MRVRELSQDRSERPQSKGEIIGKQGFVYVLNRDNLGMYSANDSQVIQEFPLIPGETNNQVKDVQFGSPCLLEQHRLLLSRCLTGLGFSGVRRIARHSPQNRGVSRQSFPSISANGNTNGILWDIGGPNSSPLTPLLSKCSTPRVRPHAR